MTLVIICISKHIIISILTNWFSPGKHWTPHLLEKGQYPANGRIKRVFNYSFKFNDIDKILKIWIEISPKVFNCSSKLNIIARTLPMTFNLGLMGSWFNQLYCDIIGRQWNLNTNYKDYLITAICQNIELWLNWILLFWNNLFEIWSQLRSSPEVSTVQLSKLTLSRLQDHWVEGWAGCSTWIYEGPWKYQINKKISD